MLVASVSSLYSKSVRWACYPPSSTPHVHVYALNLQLAACCPRPISSTRASPRSSASRFCLHLVQNLALEKNHCLSPLRFSGFGQGQPLRRPCGATRTAVLDGFTTEEFAQQPLEQLSTFLDPRAVVACDRC